MKTAILLAAGDGTKIWPYAELRPKAMIPVAGKPVIAHQVESLLELGFETLIVAGGRMSEQITNYFRQGEDVSPRAREAVQVVRVGAAEPRGTAFTLLAAADRLEVDEPFLTLYGDTVVGKEDLARLIARFEGGGSPAAALVAPLGEEPSQDWICCRLGRAGSDGAADGGEPLEIADIMGHPRDGYTHRFGAFAFSREFLSVCSANSGLFSRVQVGMMPAPEGYLEMSLVDYLHVGGSIPAVEAHEAFIDMDKPWHILQANELLVSKRCGVLTEHELAEGASIDPSADIRGFVRLGEGSRIGRNVSVSGNLIVGSGTVIENGAILQGNHVIGNDCYIGNYCYLAEGSSVGSRCVINHCAELDGLIMDNVYLYHYMEFYGIIGASTDLGAATVCGTLRFDDGQTIHRIKGRRELPRAYADAVYLGDYSRTGVNAILMPGVKIGVHSIVGPGVLLQEDVPNRTIVSVKQELTSKPWGPERYGW
ncbi:sugar phosphate nucleotidyltransferase [Paenibacillus sp. HB172176]|uniref:sugar phosphate nucleotidyltransferase n=1 Tax=Paenibacillus sp. HB172176 TaxID=2493690 RepID=UPI001438AFEB|nr:sugar phosphate nucleotidyltransferase [Paenibacillus sp. HB172176]